MEETGRILIADDEETFLHATADLLRKNGYECGTASNGQEAMALLSQAEYDLLIADIKMPGNAQLELAHEIAESEAPLPILLITAYPSLHTAVEALELPVVGYLMKPLQFDDMFFQVRRGVARGRLQRLIRGERRRVERWLETATLTEANLRHHDEVARQESVDSYLAATYQNLISALTDLKSLLDVVVSHRRTEPVCEVTQCARHEEMKELIVAAEQVLGRLSHPGTEAELRALTIRLRDYLAGEGGTQMPH